MAFMSKFKVGDKVRMLAHNRYPDSGAGHYFEGAVGYINELYNGLWVIWGEKNRDGKYFGHFAENELELVTAKKEKEINPPFYVDCPTKEIWDRVAKKMGKMGYVIDPEGTIKYGYDYCRAIFNDISDKAFGLSVKQGDPYIWCGNYESTDGKHIPYQEFLGEEDNVGDFKIGDTVKIIDNGKTYSTYDVMARMLKADKWESGNTHKSGTVGVIKAKHRHEAQPVYLYLFEADGFQSIIGEEGLEKVEAPKTATEDYWSTAATTSSDKPLSLKEMQKYYDLAISERWGIDSLASPDFGKPIKSFTQRIMDTLRSIPDRLKRALNANLRAFYKLGWIDGDLDVTAVGESELKNFLFDKYEKELGAIAMKKVKAASKKKKEDEDEETEE